MKGDEIALRIEAFDAANGGGVGWSKDKGVDRRAKGTPLAG